MAPHTNTRSATLDTCAPRSCAASTSKDFGHLGVEHGAQSLVLRALMPMPQAKSKSLRRLKCLDTPELRSVSCRSSKGLLQPDLKLCD